MLTSLNQFLFPTSQLWAIDTCIYLLITVFPNSKLSSIVLCQPPNAKQTNQKMARHVNAVHGIFFILLDSDTWTSFFLLLCWVGVRYGICKSFCNISNISYLKSLPPSLQFLKVWTHHHLSIFPPRIHCHILCPDNCKNRIASLPFWFPSTLTFIKKVPTCKYNLISITIEMFLSRD
jgi:hypothetical protein